ncbi:MAG: hypothetical protein JW793_10465 [Acidobacteria bacterium]|nr:hypothetical protein [Acidobacteriota bacterium]
MIDLIKKLKAVLKEKEISPETAARYIGVSGREVRRWIEGKVTPLPLSRKAIKAGIKQIERNL